MSNTGSGNGGGGNKRHHLPIGPYPHPRSVVPQRNAFSHTSNPQFNATQSQVANLVDNTHNYQETFSAGFLTGGKASLSYTDAYQKENAGTDVLNPTNGTALSISLQHSLLNGFGRALNARNITIAKANIGINDYTFKTQVIGVVVSVLNSYSLGRGLSGSKAKRQALSVAQQFFEDNKKQVQIGTMAPLDVTTAEAQVATSEQDLVVSETTLEQDQVTFKNLISRNGLADTELAAVEVIPVDRIDVPQNETLPPFKEALAIAMTNRADLEVDRLNLINSKTSTLGTNNGVLPQVVVFANAKQQGLSGTPRTCWREQFLRTHRLSFRPGLWRAPHPSVHGRSAKYQILIFGRDYQCARPDDPS